MKVHAPRASWVWAAVLLGAAAAAIFGASLGYEFVWDDRALLQEDVRIRSLSGILEAFGSDFFRSSDHTMQYGYYRPIITVSYALDFWIWRDWPGGYHLTNIILHFLCTLGLLLLGRHMKLGVWVSTGIALLFVAHPLHAESVTWISGRTDVIATLFAIGYLLGFDHPARRWRVAAYVSFALAAMSKEVALATPAVAFFMSAVRSRNTFFERVKLVAPVVPILAGYLCIRALVVPVKPSMGSPNGFMEHLFGPLGALTRYLKMLVWPGEQCAYLQTPVSADLSDPWAAFGLAIILLAVQLWLTHRQIGRMAFAVLLSFVPMANIVRVAAPMNMGFPMSERFLYLPSLVLALAVGVAWVDIRERLPAVSQKSWTRVSAVLVALSVAVLTVRTLERNEIWRDELSMFTDASAKVEDAPLVNWQLASVYRRVGKLDEAYALVMDAVENSRTRRQAIPAPMIVTLATTTAQRGDIGGAIRVLERYQRETGAVNAMISYNLGVLHQEEGRNLVSLKHYEEAYTARPKYVPAFMAAAVMLLRLDRNEEAIALMRRVHLLDPRHSSAWHALGIAYREQGESDKALDAFLRTVDLVPTSVAPRIDAASILMTRDPQRALALLIEVKSAHPDHEKLGRAIEIVRGKVAQ